MSLESEQRQYMLGLLAGRREGARAIRRRIAIVGEVPSLVDFSSEEPGGVEGNEISIRKVHLAELVAGLKTDAAKLFLDEDLPRDTIPNQTSDRFLRPDECMAGWPRPSLR